MSEVLDYIVYMYVSTDVGIGIFKLMASLGHTTYTANGTLVTPMHLTIVTPESVYAVMVGPVHHIFCPFLSD